MARSRYSSRLKRPEDAEERRGAARERSRDPQIGSRLRRVYGEAAKTPTVQPSISGGIPNVRRVSGKRKKRRKSARERDRRYISREAERRRGHEASESAKGRAGAERRARIARGERVGPIGGPDRRAAAKTAEKQRLARSAIINREMTRRRIARNRAEGVVPSARIQLTEGGQVHEFKGGHPLDRPGGVVTPQEAGEYADFLTGAQQAQRPSREPIRGLAAYRAAMPQISRPEAERDVAAARYGRELATPGAAPPPPEGQSVYTQPRTYPPEEQLRSQVEARETQLMIGGMGFEQAHQTAMEMVMPGTLGQQAQEGASLAGAPQAGPQGAGEALLSQQEASAVRERMAPMRVIPDMENSPEMQYLESRISELAAAAVSPQTGPAEQVQARQAIDNIQRRMQLIRSSRPETANIPIETTAGTEQLSLPTVAPGTEAGLLAQRPEADPQEYWRQAEQEFMQATAPVPGLAPLAAAGVGGVPAAGDPAPVPGAAAAAPSGIPEGLSDAELTRRLQVRQDTRLQEAHVEARTERTREREEGPRPGTEEYTTLSKQAEAHFGELPSGFMNTGTFSILTNDDAKEAVRYVKQIRNLVGGWQEAHKDSPGVTKIGMSFLQASDFAKNLQTSLTMALETGDSGGRANYIAALQEMLKIIGLPVLSPSELPGMIEFPD